jgi:hypothetical protein
MLGRRASSSHPSRSQSEMPQFFNRLLALRVPEKTAGHILRQISDNSPDLAPRRFPFGDPIVTTFDHAGNRKSWLGERLGA